MNFYKIYEVAGPLTLLPLAIALWLSTGNGNHCLVGYAVLLPIVAGFVIPFIGIRLLGVWEIRSRYSKKGFRPHHGLLFGSATSVITWLIYQFHLALFRGGPVFLFPLVLGAILGLINFWFDAAGNSNDV